METTKERIIREAAERRAAALPVGKQEQALARLREAQTEVRKEAQQDTKALGRLGGLSRSPAKVQAVRQNLTRANAARKASGRLGGRPRKT